MQGSFDDIPADAIGVTLRPPVGGGYRAVKNSAWGLFALVGVAGLAFCWRWGGHHQLSEVPLERHRSRSRRFAGALMIGVAFGVAVFLAGMAAAWGADTLFPPTDGELALVKQLRLSDGYGPLAAVVGIMFLSVLAAGTGCVLTLSRRGRAIS